MKTFEPNPDGATLLLNGVVKVATGWNARSQLYRDESKGRVGVLLPPEGSVFQINTINMTAGSKNRAAAVAFVNYALSQPRKRRSPSGCSMRRPTQRRRSMPRRWRAPRLRRKTAPA